MKIAEQLLMQLPSIIFAAAALITSIATLVAVYKGHGKLDEIRNQVDGGMKIMQAALADIAKQATLASGKTVVVKEGQRSTDPGVTKG